MLKEKISNNLKKFNYNFSEDKNDIIVKLDFSHNVVISISDDNKIIINDRLVRWNFLTGGIPMNLKKRNALQFFGYNSICNYKFIFWLDTVKVHYYRFISSLRYLDFIICWILQFEIRKFETTTFNLD